MSAIEKIKASLGPKQTAAFERIQSQLQNVKREAQRVTDVGVTSVVTVAGGAASGVLAAKMPVLPGTNVPSDLALGIGCVGLAMMGAGGKNNEHLCSFGSGLLAVKAAKEVEKALR